MIMFLPAGCRRRRGIMIHVRKNCSGPATQKGCLTVRSSLSYHTRGRLIRTIQLHLAAQHESPSRMAGRGPRPRAGMCCIPWWKSSHRGLQLVERTTRMHADDAGCGPGLAAGRRRRNAGRRGTRAGGAGAGGAAALVVNQARTQLYATHRGGAGGGPAPTKRRCQ